MPGWLHFRSSVKPPFCFTGCIHGIKWINIFFWETCIFILWDFSRLDSKFDLDCWLCFLLWYILLAIQSGCLVIYLLFITFKHDDEVEFSCLVAILKFLTLIFAGVFGELMFWLNPGSINHSLSSIIEDRLSCVLSWLWAPGLKGWLYNREAPWWMNSPSRLSGVNKQKQTADLMLLNFFLTKWCLMVQKVSSHCCPLG